MCQSLHVKGGMNAQATVQPPKQQQPPSSDPQQAEIDLNIERLNLFYDLLQIEIEKLRRKSIDEVIINTRREHQERQ